MTTPNVIPRHVGYIIDGNRRWAKKHGIPAYEGHLAGYNAIYDIAKATFDGGVEYVSIYVFSTENWKRSENEVKKLMGLVLRLLKSDLHIFQENNIRLKVLGSRDMVDPKILEAIDEAEDQTANNTGGMMAICFNYGGHLEIVDAVKKVVQLGVSSDDITTKLIESNLYAPEVPPVDILVRTGGDQRISNFMLWRMAYGELMFMEKLWPDMTKADVIDILNEYNKRNRRFGG
jgi:undecaprenyl diphosphate synthase